jgi:hypothetical protein
MTGSLMSERDVVFTPFMLRVREALSGTAAGAGELRLEASPEQTIAIAVDEWFGLRARAEHMIAEANAMLAPAAPRIELHDEYGTGDLAFVIRWGARWARLVVAAEPPPGHAAHVELQEPGGPARVKPADLAVVEDLIVDLLANQS